MDANRERIDRVRFDKVMKKLDPNSLEYGKQYRDEMYYDFVRYVPRHEKMNIETLIAAHIYNDFYKEEVDRAKDNLNFLKLMRTFDDYKKIKPEALETQREFVRHKTDILRYLLLLTEVYANK